MPNTRYLFLCLLAASYPAAAASPLIFGARGGVPFNVTDSIISRFTSSAPTQRFTIGPTLGVRLPLGFSVEGDALYTRSSVNLVNVAGLRASTSSGSWQFPVMAKFTAGRQMFAPVVGAGVSVRHTQDFVDVPAFLAGGSLTGGTSVGFVAGAGLRIKAGPANITPEIRYTYWGPGSLSQSLLSFLPFSRHEATALLSLTF